MRPGETIKTTKPIRSHKSGVILPQEGTFVRAIENLGRTLILVSFAKACEEYLFPDEIQTKPSRAVNRGATRISPAVL